jgi:hypothetical protein
MYFSSPCTLGLSPQLILALQDEAQAPRWLVSLRKGRSIVNGHWSAFLLSCSCRICFSFYSCSSCFWELPILLRNGGGVRPIYSAHSHRIGSSPCQLMQFSRLSAIFHIEKLSDNPILCRSRGFPGSEDRVPRGGTKGETGRVRWERRGRRGGDSKGEAVKANGQ